LSQAKGALLCGDLSSFGGGAVTGSLRLLSGAGAGSVGFLRSSAGGGLLGSLSRSNSSGFTPGHFFPGSVPSQIFVAKRRVRLLLKL